MISMDEAARRHVAWSALDSLEASLRVVRVLHPRLRPHDQAVIAVAILRLRHALSKEFQTAQGGEADAALRGEG